MYKVILPALLLLISQLGLSQEVPFISYQQLTNRIEQSKAEIIAVNFWATWCGPCIKELPYFESINERREVEVIFVSLDFPEEMPKVKKVVEKKNIKSSVVLLNEKDYDSYMPKVNENWSGAIPATLFLDQKRKQYFYESAFTLEELNKVIDKIKNQS